MAAIRAVLFDLFGTLVPNFRRDEYTALLDADARRLRMNPDAFREAWQSCFYERATGAHKSVSDTIEKIRPALGGEITDEALRLMREYRRAFTLGHLQPFEGVLDVLDTVRKGGRGYALVSDCSTELPALWHLCPLCSRFETVVFSCEQGIKKPDPRMYRIACDRLGVEPKACLFVGDGGSHELRGAERVGMRPVLADYQKDALRYDEDRRCDLRIGHIRDLPSLIQAIDGNR